MRHKKSKCLLFLISAMLGSMLINPFALMASDHVPYDTYNYNYRKYIVKTPAAYVPDSSISGITFNIGPFSNPQDLCVAEDGLIYIADTGNSRIVVLSADMTQVVKEIKTFDNNGTEDTFLRPCGVAVSGSDELYIADSEHRRIVVLNAKDETLVKIIENPQSELFEESFIFTPQKIEVDYADRIYCIAQGVTEGIMAFQPDGTFTGYYGTIKVKISLKEKIWRKISTKAQKSKQALFIAPEFTGIDIDEYGFIYASNLDSDGVQAVKRLNPKGEDVLVKGANKNVGGDLQTSGPTLYSGPSTIIDVVYRGQGIYSLLDSKRGRIFTYDSEGNLLYIFGGLGSQSGTFVKPAAIEQVGDKIIVLDATKAEILIFDPTNYGTLINEAVALRYSGDETLAVDKWAEVLKLDENFELANVGIGKAYLSSGEYKEAMKYLKLGMSREYYSIAFKRYRNEVLKENMGTILTLLIVGIIAITVVRYVVKRKRNGYTDTEEGGLE